jgi:hypothetical protein
MLRDIIIIIIIIMVVIVIEVEDVAMGENGLITATIMVIIRQILTNPHRMRRNKNGRRIYIAKIPKR